MRYQKDRARALLTFLAGTAALAVASPAAAQDGDAQPAPPAPELQTEEEIIVLGQREALSRGIAEERESDNLVNVVEATDIGQFADQNVAESLQRVPGVTLNRAEGEGRSVSIRGLPSAFTPVTINGVRLGTSSLTTAQVQLDSIANDQLAEIEVYKAALPSQDADTIGGVINLVSSSAFNATDTQLTLRAENIYSEDADDSGPRLGATFLTRLLDDRLGIAASLSYSDRVIDGVELESEEGLNAVSAAGTDEPEFLRPEEIAVIFETGNRERINGTLNLEFRPSDGVELFARGTYAHLNDSDISYRDIFDLDSANGSDVAAVRPRGGRFNDVDISKRLFFQDITDEVLTLSGGGSITTSGWRLGGQVDYSRSEFDNPEALRGRFRERDALVEIDGTDEAFNIRPGIGERGSRGNPFQPVNFELDQLLAVSELRTDEVLSFRLDAAREFDLFGGPAEIAVGGRIRLRQKTNDREEFTGNPDSVDFERTLADLPLFVDNGNFGYASFYPSLGPSFAWFRQARQALITGAPAFQRQDLSAAGDYVLSEDVYAGYIQLRLEPAPGLRLIGGVRVEHTESGSEGFFTEFDSSGRGPNGAPGTIIDLGNVADEYTEFFPGLHLRWELGPTFLLRASYNRGLQRPDFDDRRNVQRVQFEADDPEDRDLFAGNPFLEPLIADQFDATLAWYPVRDTVVQASAFYKSIRNFFIDFAGDGEALADLGIALPPGVSPDFDRIQTTINGDEAEVYGVELQLVHNFRYLPGFLGGLFVQANATLVESTSSASVRAGEEFALPGQRDLIANFSVGYENEELLLRVAGNYQGEALVDLASSAEEDVFVKPGFNLDVNARFRVGRNFELTFDVINLTDEAQIRFYQGNAAGPLVSVNSSFGRTYQAGARVTF